MLTTDPGRTHEIGLVHQVADFPVGALKFHPHHCSPLKPEHGGGFCSCLSKVGRVPPENDYIRHIFNRTSPPWFSWSRSHLIITTLPFILDCSFVTPVPVTPSSLWFLPSLLQRNCHFLSFYHILSVIMERCISQSIHLSSCFPLFPLPSILMLTPLPSIYPSIAPFRFVCPWNYHWYIEITHNPHLQVQVITGVYTICVQDAMFVGLAASRCRNLSWEKATLTRSWCVT